MITTITVSPLLAEIPILDWSGPSFLTFYPGALLLAAIWSWRRFQWVLRPLEVPGVAAALGDPYQVAYLSAGNVRVAQMVVSRLILMGAASWLFLLALGFLKAVIGLVRDKPVLFLVALMLVTVVLVFILMSKVPRVTAPGKDALEQLRAVWPKRARHAESGTVGQGGNLDAVCMSLALFGPAALSDLPGFGAAADGMARYLGQAPASADGGGGCSSRCGAGSSGCGGGGGCGGCGGGGGD